MKQQPLEQFSIIILSEFFGISLNSIIIIFLFISIVLLLFFFVLYKSLLFGTNLEFLLEDVFYMVSG
jgi:hypothetical protein